MAIRLYYMTRRDGGLNFGDDLSPLVLAHATGQSVEPATIADCDVIGLGSLLQECVKPARIARLTLRRLSGRPRPLVWGTGLISNRRAVLTMRHLRVLAVRGPETAAACGLGATLPMGDPGLIVAGMMQPRRHPPRHALGLIAHYADEKSPELAAARAALPKALQIPVDAPAMEVVAAIADCAVILSSSLHGLIVADALGIPNARLHFTDRVQGGDFKFLDHAASVGRPPLLPEATLPDPDEVAARDYRYQAGLPAIARRLVTVIRDALRD